MLVKHCKLHRILTWNSTHPGPAADARPHVCGGDSQVRMQTSAESMSGYRVSNYGMFETVSMVMHNTLMDLGCGKEDANVVMNMMLQTILRESRGHTTMVFFLDCCAVSNCSALNWFTHFVVDKLKLLKALGLVYFWNCHGAGYTSSANAPACCRGGGRVLPLPAHATKLLSPCEMHAGGSLVSRLVFAYR